MGDLAAISHLNMGDPAVASFPCLTSSVWLTVPYWLIAQAWDMDPEKAHSSISSSCCKKQLTVTNTMYPTPMLYDTWMAITSLFTGELLSMVLMMGIVVHMGYLQVYVGIKVGKIKRCDQASELAHDGAAVPVGIDPFPSSNWQEVFWQDLQHVHEIGHVCYGYGMQQVEWGEEGYPKLEAIPSG
ncbi:hypothetical protein BKA82DRAFT_4014352 [Pisolithus tinctorius]|nr:hypothetical protein BKA82DRAFT_4014352 [Pisolithus tinctorius]